MIQIVPSVLATSPQQYLADISKLSSCEGLSKGWVHIDFADNIFVQNKTIESSVIGQFPTPLRKEAHLMVAQPKKWIEGLVKVGIERVIFHIEAEDDTDDCINYIKEKDLEVGLALKSESPIEKLTPFIPKIDMVLLMSIIAGFQGQSFIPKSLDTVRELKSKGWDIQVGIDGGVKDDNIKEVVDAGVDFVIVGSYLLEGNIDENLENLWEVING